MKVKNGKKVLMRSLIVLSVLIILLLFSFLVWSLDYYHADEVALALLEEEHISQVDSTYVITPEDATSDLLVFYPGAKVEAAAYLPLFNNIASKTKITCVLVEMPLKFAIFNGDAAMDIIERYPEAENVYIAGHSLGSAVAGSFSASNVDVVDALIVMGGYVYGEYPIEHTLTIYGTFDAEHGEHTQADAEVVVIEGGNHAQYGNYGSQSGDPDATISAEEQQEITAEAVLAFLSEQG